MSEKKLCPSKFNNLLIIIFASVYFAIGYILIGPGDLLNFWNWSLGFVPSGILFLYVFGKNEVGH